MSTPVALTDLSLIELEELAKRAGQPSFAGRNLARWIYERRVRDLPAMTDLSQTFRDWLAGNALVRQVGVVTERQDPSGTTAYVLRLRDGKTIETVLIPEGERRTVCVSTQVGCAIGCVFCASGLNGLLRNLSAGEILEQVLHVQDQLPQGERVSNIVVMGIGEPTMNLPALLRALEMWNHPRGFGIGARRITISTIGFPTKIDRLAATGKEFGLAISLHAPRDDLREKLLPGASQIKLADLIAAVRRYYQATHRRVTFEYVLLEGQNDGPRESAELVRLLESVPCAVNLIPVNLVEGLPYRRPSAARVDRFRQTLLDQGLQVTRRRTRGDGIAAACGQLRLRVLAKESGRSQ